MLVDTFPVVETTGYIQTLLEKNIASFNRMTRSISIRIIGLVIELFKMPIDTFPVVETTGYISNISREKHCLWFQPHDDKYLH
ncbi:hypothetical protein D0817_13505 [Flavobacterium cupreum]|uniref:Uncharacterized protein n=1 Tax=Flavobacterium cupreum TaxID=2133766 RepID=A0A434A5M4_9FLAO|nr:hypothetical protein D0817_13505 [Flavobacterium cupreum]